jgi:serine/threonine protein phosphatase PrpC
MKILLAGLTDVGLKRENNQDSFLLDSDLGLFVVADGMGGHRGGEVASSLAVQAIREVVSHSFENEQGVNPRELLIRAYQEANRRIYEFATAKPELKGMGTTTVGAIARNGYFYIANVGDSRAYLLSNGSLWQITEDHSLVNEQLRAGHIKESDLSTHTAKNIITRSVGFEMDVACDIVERRIMANDTIMMCSDGLSGLVKDAKIAELMGNPSLDLACQNLIEEAKKNGGDDNVTVVLLRAIVE